MSLGGTYPGYVYSYYTVGSYYTTGASYELAGESVDTDKFAPANVDADEGVESCDTGDCVSEMYFDL